METPENLFTAFRREITLNVTYQKDQKAQQYCDFNDIVEKKFNASNQAGGSIKSQNGKTASDQPIKPFHAEYLVLKKVPDCF